MRYLFKCSILVIFLLLLSSCSFDISPKATKEQQEQVKNQVMQLLEKEYNQPLKLLDFKYEYEFHNTYSFLYIIFRKYGNYHFRIQAVDNPVIIMDFDFNDGLATKESIKPLIDSFKKNQLNDLYCTGLSSIYFKQKEKTVDQILLKKAEKYCDRRNQTWYQKWKRLNKK
ncbi:hypothetical protein LO80_06550 [Candidatus Francisella endociliophora]|uniref:Lipoprotein n=1 Tax=Candidatus Francisella endociliophora TaxID=653937 RepID=A0A097EQ12_9GAMM|nr:hypothetical protein [Francisella sp. FSC1006]AIT09655.1 hypothetical protein LO80_06550 [Francisella sp. FSC1006]